MDKLKEFAAKLESLTKELYEIISILPDGSKGVVNSETATVVKDEEYNADGTRSVTNDSVN